MKLIPVLLMTIGFVSSAMATSLQEVGRIVSGSCTSGELDRSVVTKNLELRDKGYLTLSAAKALILDPQTRLVKSGYGFIENNVKLTLVLASTTENPYCTAKQIKPATKDQPAREENVAVGSVIIVIEKQ